MPARTTAAASQSRRCSQVKARWLLQAETEPHMQPSTLSYAHKHWSDSKGGNLLMHMALSWLVQFGGMRVCVDLSHSFSLKTWAYARRNWGGKTEWYAFLPFHKSSTKLLLFPLRAEAQNPSVDIAGSYVLLLFNTHLLCVKRNLHGYFFLIWTKHSDKNLCQLLEIIDRRIWKSQLRSLWCNCNLF